MRLLSPRKSINKADFKKGHLRPFSSIEPRTTKHQKSIKNMKNFKGNERNMVKYIVENNLYENQSEKYHKISETKNHYNKLNIHHLKGKEKYSNFSIFSKRELDFKDLNIPINQKYKKLTRQQSAIQLNSHRAYKDNPLYLTETIIKKNHRKVSNYIFNNNYNYINDLYIPYIDLEDKNENIIINNHKYKNISLLREIEQNKSLNKTSYGTNWDKKKYLFNKKMEYITLYKKKGNSLYKYMENLDDYIKKKYNNLLKEERAKIIAEEFKNEHEFIDNKINSLNKANNLYNETLVYKYGDYIKFLGKQIDLNNKENYYLLNEVFILQKDVHKLRAKINKLLEQKKYYNKFIFLQICVQEKKIKLPDYYEYIFNHTLEESINYCKDILKENEIKQILDYKKNIIYKNFDIFNEQIKMYESENRELYNNLEIIKKELFRLNLEKNELFEEDEKLNKYLENKLAQKEKEKKIIINRYNNLLGQKNSLMIQMKFNYLSEYIINTKKFHNKKKDLHHNNSYNLNKVKSHPIARNPTSNKNNKSFLVNFNNNIRAKIRHASAKSKPKPKSFITDEQLFQSYNINYDNSESKNHSKLYYKIKKLFILLKNYIKTEENMKKGDIITTENDLILTMLKKIEDGLNEFIKNEANFGKKNLEEIKKLKLIIEKQKKIMKGQKKMALIKAKYENMKKKIEEKNNKIYFIPKSRKRSVSASLNKRIREKRKVEELNKEKKFEDFIEDLYED